MGTTSTTATHAAPGSTAGTVFQFERALAWLANGDLPLDARVGIETDDDVAVQIPDGLNFREQDKHSVGRPPFTNGSEKLWKTLLIWLEAARAGSLNLDQARLFLVTNQRLPDDCLALLFTPDPPPEAVRRRLERVAAYAAQARREQLQICRLTDEVLAHGESVLLKLFAVVVCLDARHGTVSAELRQKICGQLQMLADDPRDEIVDELAGWHQRQVQELIRAQQPAWVTREAFLRQHQAIQMRRQRQRRRERSESLIPVTLEDTAATRGRTFVQQLELINADDDLQIEAIADYLRCNIERGRLTEQGDITELDWTSFDTNINKYWKTQQRRILSSQAAATSRTEEEVGNSLYLECLNYRESLAGEPTQEFYLTRGTLHRQADNTLLGWHPRYSDFIKKPS